MKRMMIVFLGLAFLLLGIGSLNAQEDLVETVAKGCEIELEKYCAQMTPGEGRLLECIEKNDKQVSDR